MDTENEYATVTPIPAIARLDALTYRVPDGLDVQTGHLVWVPSGPRTVQGIVFGITETPEVEETRDLERVAYEQPLISSCQIKVARWMSTYYRVGLFMAAAQMLPPGFASRLRTWVSVDAQRAADPSVIDDLGQRDHRAIQMVTDAGEMRRPALARRLMATQVSATVRGALGRDDTPTFRLDDQSGNGHWLGHTSMPRVRAEALADGPSY